MFPISKSGSIILVNGSLESLGLPGVGYTGACGSTCVEKGGDRQALALDCVHLGFVSPSVE